jgi:hypothetical protein
MADKKFNEFSYELPPVDNVMLHADPTTGIIKKCEVQDLPGGGSGGGGNVKVLYTGAVNQSNVGGVETDWMNYDMPADTVVNDGDYLQLYFYIRKNTATVAKTVKIYIDGILVTTMNDLSVAYFTTTYELARLSNTSYQKNGFYRRGLSNLFEIVGSGIITGFDQITNIKVTATAPSTGDMTFYYGKLILFGQ